MKVKTSELTGVALDWAVAKADQPGYSDKSLMASVQGGYDGIGNFHEPYSPTTKWAQGGPLIEKYGIELSRYSNGGVDTAQREVYVADGGYMQMEDYVISVPEVVEWTAWWGCGCYKHSDKTPLLAAMRCIVNYKLGNEVEVPEGLRLSTPSRRV